METVRQSWTDERLDEFGKRVDERFDRVDQRFDDVDARFEQVDKRFEQVDKRFDRLETKLLHVDSRLDAMGRSIVVAAIAMSSTMIAGFGAMVAVIATKL